MTLSRIGFLVGLFCLVGCGYVSAQGIDVTGPITTTKSATTIQPATTPAPTTQPATTPASTTQPATTPASTTQPATTPASTTQPATTPAPTTQPATTPAPTTQPATTPVPTTQPATTLEPTTQSNSTSGDVTTTPLVTTAPTPSPGKPVGSNTYTVKKDNETCLMVQMATQFVLKNGEVINVTKEAIANLRQSSCSVLYVDFGIKNSFQLHFGTDKDNKTYYLEKVVANIDGDNETATNLTLGKASMKASYKCIAGFSVHLLPNMTMNATSVQFQAFQVDDEKFGTAVDCKTGKDLNPVIPIVVGSVLAVLVLIVVVAYIIGRRRNRTGYEEI